MTLRPALRPGAAVLRRDAHHLQVGTSPGIVIADRPGLMTLLLSLDGAHDLAALARLVPEMADVAGTVLELTARGAVVDATTWDSRWHEEARSASLAGSDRDPRDRERLAVTLLGDPGCRGVRDTVATILGEAGVHDTDRPDPDLLVVMSSGEPARAVLSDARDRGTPHLLVRLDEDRALIGPLVIPGRSPCLECADLHRTDWDPAWRVLLPQLGRRAAQHNPPALGAVLRHCTATEVAAVVLAAADRAALPLLGEVLAVGPAPDQRDRWPVRFHHRCACTLLSA